MKWSLFSFIFSPISLGAPEVITLTGLPQVCPSMHLKVLRAIFYIVNILIDFFTSIAGPLNLL